MEELITLYKNTNYEVTALDLTIKVHEYNQRLDFLMNKNNWLNYTFITAWNPQSRLQKLELNKKANLELLKDLLAFKAYIFPGSGKPKNDNWEAEESWLAFNLDLEISKSLMNKYKQHAIVYGEINGQAELIFNENFNNAKRDIL